MWEYRGLELAKGVRAMFELFHLSAPWWMFVLRAAAIYALVMVLVRVSGKRAVGQITPFDLVLLILIGNAVQNGINGGDDSLTGAAIMATTLIALNYGVAYVTSRSRRRVSSSILLLILSGELSVTRAAVSAIIGVHPLFKAPASVLLRAPGAP